MENSKGKFVLLFREGEIVKWWTEERVRVSTLKFKAWEGIFNSLLNFRERKVLVLALAVETHKYARARRMGMDLILVPWSIK